MTEKIVGPVQPSTYDFATLSCSREPYTPNLHFYAVSFSSQKPVWDRQTVGTDNTHNVA